MVMGSIFPIAGVHAVSDMSSEIFRLSDNVNNSVSGPSTDYLLPGSPSLNYGSLSAGEHSYIVFEEDDERRVFVGTLKEKMITTTKENRPFLLRIHELQTHDQTRQSLVMADIEAGHVVFDAVTDDQYSATHNYTDENLIAGEFNYSDKQTESIHTKVQFPVFSAEALDVIIRSIPLFEGYEAHFIGYDHRKTDLFTPVTVTVENLETITAHKGDTHRTWRVNAVTEHTNVTYYVDKYSREIVRIELKQSSENLLVMEQF